MTYAQALLSMREWNNRQAFLALAQGTDRFRFARNPTYTNAAFLTNRNAIGACLRVREVCSHSSRLLGTPVLRQELSEVIFASSRCSSSRNYGILGAVLGHELTHAFDDFGDLFAARSIPGALFDENGNRRNWWSAETGKRFDMKQRCVADQYSKYQLEHRKGFVKGYDSLSESIADNGGLRQAYYVSLLSA